MRSSDACKVMMEQDNDTLYPWMHAGWSVVLLPLPILYGCTDACTCYLCLSECKKIFLWVIHSRVGESG